MKLPSDPFHKTSGASLLHRLRVTTVLLVSSFAALVITASIYSLTQQYRVVLDTTTRSALNAAKAVESHASQEFGETYRILEGIADVYRHAVEQGELKEGAAVDETFLHDLMASKLPLAPAIMSVFVLNKDYKGVAGARTYPVDISRAYGSGISFEALTDIDDNLFIGEIYRDLRPQSPPNRWIFPVGVKVRDRSGALQGFVYALMRPEFFSNYYATLDVGAHGRIAMWTPEGRLISATPNEKTAVGAIDRTQATLPTASGEAVITTGMNIAQEVSAHRSIANMPLRVSVVLDAEDFLESWRAARDAVSLAVAVVVLVMAAAALIILRQITHSEKNEMALREAKAAAEEANAAKSRFLAHMSHEFRTPLNAIMGFSEIIKDKILGDSIAPTYMTYAGHIHRSGGHLLNIVNDILDMAKIESGAQPLNREPIDMAGVITDAVSFVEGIALQKQVRIRIAVPAGLPLVSGDQRFSSQVVINLLSNAIKFSPAPGEVVVTAHYAEGRHLDIAVIDHGPGIEPVLLKRLGELFLQGNPAISHSGQGTGLGLSICMRYMDLLGGQLIIDSVAGSGTTAIIRFPASLLMTQKFEGEPRAPRARS